MESTSPAIISRFLSTDIKKPTALVHFQRNLSQVAQRVMTLLIFNTQENEPDAKGHYEIQARFIHDFLGWTESKNYERIYGALREIKIADIVWNFMGEDRTLDELHCSLLITLGVSRRSGVIRYKFHPELMPVIKNPSVFAKLKLIMLAVLASPKYAYPLYEFIADSFCRGKPIERISLAKLKNYLGIPATSYTDYITFKDQVLKPAIAAINRISDYTVSYTTYREGRRVVGVVFTIERKRQWQQPLLLEKPLAVLQRFFGVAPSATITIADTNALSAFIASVGRHGIDERTARAAVTAHGVQGAREIAGKVMRDVRRREKSANPVLDVGAYMARCLREGFGKLSEAERTAATRARAEAATRQEQAQLDQRQAAQKEVIQEERRRRVQSLIAALTPAERAMYEERFRAAADAGVYGAVHRGKSPNAPGTKAAFLSFMAEKLLAPVTTSQQPHSNRCGRNTL